MGRIRTIKPKFFKHEELFDAERETGLPLRLAYAGLWCQADREGRFVWHPRELKSDVLPYDEVDFSRVLDALATRGWVRKYRVNGRTYGAIVTFKDHQVVNNREAESFLPSPDEDEGIEPVSTRAPRVPDATPTPLKPALVEQEQEQEQEQERETPSLRSGVRARRSSADDLSASDPELVAIARTEGRDIDRELANFRDWVAGGGPKKPIKDFRARFRNWLRSPFGRETPGVSTHAPRPDRPRTGTDWLRADPEFVAAAARLVDNPDGGNGPADAPTSAGGTHRGDDRSEVESGGKIPGRALPKPAGSHPGSAPGDRPRLVAVDEVSAPIGAGGADRLVVGLREPGSGIGSTSGAHESDATAFGGRASAGSGTSAAQVADGPRVPHIGGARTDGRDHAGAAADVTRAVGADLPDLPTFLRRA